MYGIVLTVIHIGWILAYGSKNHFSWQWNSFLHVNERVVNFLPLGYGITACVWLVKAYHLVRTDLFSAWVIVIPSLAIILFSLWGMERWYKQKKGKKWLMYLSITLLVVSLIYRPALLADRWHQNYFLSPANDVYHGRIPFVDTVSQYGLGVIYWLALVFKLLQLPLGYEGLSFILAILFILQYLWIFFILWETMDDLFTSVLGLLVVIYFNYMTVYWVSMLKFPAHSPLRYGLVYLLLGLAVLHLKRQKRYLKVLEFVFIGVASLWSLEAFVYTLVSINAFYFVTEELSKSRFEDGAKAFFHRLGLQMGVVGFAWAIAMLLIYAASGALPDMRIYLEYFKQHVDVMPTEGSVTLHIFITGSVLSVYLFSIFSVVYDRLRQQGFFSEGMAALLVGFSAAGIVRYVYYFVYYEDYVFAVLATPFICVMTLWVGILRQNKVSPALSKSAGLALLCGLVLTMTLTSQNFYNKFSKSLLYMAPTNSKIAFRNPYHTSPSNDSVASLIDLIQKYAGEEERVAIFVDSNNQAEALFLTGKIDLLGMSEADMSEVSLIYSQIILENARSLKKKPEYIFYCPDPNCMIPLQREAFQIIFANGNYKMIEKRRGVIVLKRGD
jgi:hypothetical protein